MTTAEIPTDQRLEGVPISEVLEGLARLHQLVVVADAGGRIVWMSDALGVICGGVRRYIGRNVRDLIPSLPKPEAEARGTAKVRRRLGQHETLQDVHLHMRDPAGEPVSVDVSAFNVSAGDDADRLTIAIVRRLEEREQAERVPPLAGSANHGAAILDALPDGVLALDASNFITYANPAAEALLAGPAGSASAIGKPIALFLPHATGFGRIASRIEPGGEMGDQEFELRLPDGRTTWLAVSTRPVETSDDSPTGRVLTLRDVSERRRSEESLRHQNGELESFVHSVSHDLRSPLVSMLGFTRLLRQDYEGELDDTGRHFLDRIEQAGLNMERLLCELLELSRIGRPGQNRTWVDPRSVLMQLHAELKPRLDESHTQLSLPSAPPLVLCDRTRLYQVLSNLVGNALNHMGDSPDPHVWVEIREETGRHRLSVRDNGVGIAPEHHERIFEPFQCLGRRKADNRSAGMGLAIVKKIAETHEGRAWVESDLGSGSTFHVTLPAPQ